MARKLRQARKKKKKPPPATEDAVTTTGDGDNKSLEKRKGQSATVDETIEAAAAAIAKAASMLDELAASTMDCDKDDAKERKSSPATMDEHLAVNAATGKARDMLDDRTKKKVPSSESVTDIGDGKNHSKKRKSPPADPFLDSVLVATTTTGANSGTSSSNQNQNPEIRGKKISKRSKRRLRKQRQKLRGKQCPPGWNEYGKNNNKSTLQKIPPTTNNDKKRKLSKRQEISGRQNNRNFGDTASQFASVVDSNICHGEAIAASTSTINESKNSFLSDIKNFDTGSDSNPENSATINGVAEMNTSSHEGNDTTEVNEDTYESDDLVPDDESRASNDHAITSHGKSSQSILFLEEQAKIHEATLRAWRKRREDIQAEKEAALVKKRELMDLRTNLIELQDALVLQEELRESLAMSREKLKRLTTNETSENHDDGGDAGTEGWSVAGMGAESASFDASLNLLEEGSDGTQLEDSSKEPPVSANDFPVVFDSYRSLKELTRYHSGTEDSRCHHSLSGFLPYLDAAQVGDYLTLMLRETYILDQHDGKNSNTENKERSLRRQLLQNSCLDVLLLAPPNTKKGDGEQHFGLGAYSDATPQFFDPSISLCPYELGGICADDFCPYQHTTKTTKVLARERLPLPSFPSSFLSVEAAPTPNEKPKTATERTKAAMPKAAINVEDKQEPPISASDATLANHGDNVENEEDFIMLPASGHPNSNENGNCSDNEVDSASNGDDDNASEEEDLILLTSSFDTNDNKSDDESEIASNGDHRSSEGSDDELQDELLPLPGAHSTREVRSERETENFIPFWWGGKMVTNQDDRTENALSKSAKTTTLSILGVLEYTFGVVIHEQPKSSMTGAKDGLSSEKKTLEIKNMVASERKDSNDSELVNELKVFGRLLDASRLGLHGGRHGIAITLSQEELSGRIPLSDESLQGFAYLLRVQIEVSRFYDDAAPSLSCFGVAFATQVGLSILSWCVAAYGKAEREQKGKNNRHAHYLKGACKSCLDLLKNPMRGTIANNSFESLDAILLENCLWDDCFSENLSGKIDDKNGLVHHGIDRNGIGNFIIYTATRKVEDLRSLILWAQRHSIPHCEELDASEQPLEERLNSIWSVAKKLLKKHMHEQQENESSGKAVDPLDWEFLCIKVIVIMGYTISGCLSNFAYATTACMPTEVDFDDEAIPGSKLSASNLAAWNLLDGAIARVLKEMRQLLVGFPLLDLVMAPLCACSVASASFLRNYSTAQNRLVECLSGRRRGSGGSTGIASTNAMAYSELLWSQLVQLRMSLPNESPAIINHSVLGSVGKKLSGKRDANDIFAWEPSKALKEENRKLVAKLRSLGIRLRHVVLWGDWMLSSSTGKDRSGQKLLRLFSKDPTELFLAKNHDNSSVMSTSFDWKADSQKLLNCNPNHEFATTIDLTEQCFGGRCYPPPVPLPRLPLFFLYAGKFLTSLNLKGCSLEKLPLAFGLSFPYVQSLDISKNNLRELPDSFRRLTHRMKFLEEFRASHNQLESLPSDTLLSAATAAASVAISKSSASSPSPPLKILDLSYNRLVSVPALVGLDNLEVLELHNNALADMGVADWSRLALRLPSLRILKREDNKPIEGRGRETNAQTTARDG